MLGAGFSSTLKYAVPLTALDLGYRWTRSPRLSTQVDLRVARSTGRTVIGYCDTRDVIDTYPGPCDEQRTSQLLTAAVSARLHSGPAEDEHFYVLAGALMHLAESRNAYGKSASSLTPAASIGFGYAFNGTRPGFDLEFLLSGGVKGAAFEGNQWGVALARRF